MAEWETAAATSSTSTSYKYCMYAEKQYTLLQTAIHLYTHEDSSEETYLILVKYLAVMEVGMRKYPIDATTDRAQLGHWRLLDAHPAKAT